MLSPGSSGVIRLISSGPSAGVSGFRPCEPFTNLASKGMMSIIIQKPSFFRSSFRPIYGSRNRMLGFVNISTGS